MGEYLAKGLSNCKEQHRVVRDVRGLGLLQGMEVEMEGKTVVSECVTRGILINGTGEHVLRFVPPLIITQPEIDRLVDTLAQIFSAQAT
jgi:acetylornithine/N-succinyldiaminopimelate aminotransferase